MLLRQYGDTVHTFVDRSGWQAPPNSFLPGYQVHPRRGSDKVLAALPPTHLHFVDHCVGNQPGGWLCSDQLHRSVVLMKRSVFVADLQMEAVAEWYVKTLQVTLRAHAAARVLSLASFPLRLSFTASGQWTTHSCTPTFPRSDPSSSQVSLQLALPQSAHARVPSSRL